MDSLRSAESHEVRISAGSLRGLFAVFALIGATTSSYGTFLIGIRHHYAVSIATAGATISANFGGAVVGVIAFYWLQRHRSGRFALGVSLGVLAAGLALAAVAPDWPVFLAGVGLGGVGFGALDFGVLALVARTMSHGRAIRLSAVGAGWGFGSVLGPLVILGLGPDRYRWFLALAALLAALLVPVARGVDAPTLPADRRRELRSRRGPNRRAVLGTFMVAIASYVAYETAAAGWMATALHGWGHSSAVGTGVTACFWAGLGVGRLALGPVARRVGSHRFVIAGAAVGIVLLVVADVHAVAPVSFAVLGVALAIVFPLGLNWFTELSPDDHAGVAWLVLVDMIGGAAGSGAESGAVSIFGLSAVPLVSAAFGVLCLVAFVGARRFPAVVPAVP